MPDNDAWDRKDEAWERAVREARSLSRYRKVTAFAERMFEESAMISFPIYIGGSHVSYPIRLGGSSLRILVRLPLTDRTGFSAEKLSLEAATADYLSRQSELPIPKVHHHGLDLEIGPFAIMQDFGNKRDMRDFLETPRTHLNDPPVLRPDISDERLGILYLRIARCVLQIVQPSFPVIGSLVSTTPGSCAVLGRPITANMSTMVQLSNVPESILPPTGSTYQNTDDWYVVLAQMHMATLVFQHNDMVSSEDDCRCKYVARQLFLRLAKQHRLSKFGFAEDDWSDRSITSRSNLSMPPGSGSFRLWNDHFQPGNVLVDDSDLVAGVVDWEFTYAAPTQFVLDSPWWLLLDWPERWHNGIVEWAHEYGRRLETWLSALREAEIEMEPGSFLLSTYMRDSWETGRFWLNYAAQSSWGFDSIYWRYLDEPFFGVRDAEVPTEQLWRTRIHLLTDDEKEAMEPLVQIKMAESKERALVDWKDDEAKQRMSSFLFD
ncbi:hypothetical protein GCG54_00010432 [Colletotrichum gloeosporioides]|uniref:Phosphotransferase n=1 Tax=Colletotrichum gloeosporioides TaxID=474922 RepID=A0A8H4CWF5_COLGL|nr:uncharacterized protein GCG54_00010432 [Colletotrichum gloeosporioides]KAF3811096.1 hypothetical protein GCG54_00010432 [Colletotrichum gloeosporioides]